MPAAPYRGDSLESIQQAADRIALRDGVLEPTVHMCAEKGCDRRVIYRGFDVEEGARQVQQHRARVHPDVREAARVARKPRRPWSLGGDVEGASHKAWLAGSLVDYDDIRGDAA